MAPKNNLILQVFLAAPQIKLPTAPACVSSRTRKFLAKNMILDFSRQQADAPQLKYFKF